MNKEQEQIIDEVYENYLTNFIPPTCPPNLDVQPSYYEPMSKEWFIKSIKEKGLRGEEFSEKWGLKIEERELSFNERIKHIVNSLKSNAPLLMEEDEKTTQWLNENSIPTKLITLTYNNETIESYE
jgi:hypothetical protein